VDTFWSLSPSSSIIPLTPQYIGGKEDLRRGHDFVVVALASMVGVTLLHMHESGYVLRANIRFRPRNNCEP
jgi:hypothetical protein